MFVFSMVKLRRELRELWQEGLRGYIGACGVVATEGVSRATTG